MQTFRIGPDGIAKMRKKSLLRAIPITLIACTFGIAVAIINSRDVKVDISTFTPMIIIVPLTLGFGFWRGLKKQKTLLESYELTVSDNIIVREQLNTPDISILQTEVIEIVQQKNGNLSIKGSRNNGTIYIPAHIENYAQLKIALQQIHPIATKSKHNILHKLQYPLSFVGMGLMICVYIVNNKIVVGIAGSLFTALMTWVLIRGQKDKNIDRKTKARLWIVLLVMASIIGVTIMKLTSPTLP